MNEHRYTIMVATSEHLAGPVHYYIDLPLDVEMGHALHKRIEIPRELALFINDLQDEIVRLKALKEKP